MPPKTDCQNNIRDVLSEAVEVQLAALKSAVTFWGEWSERTAVFINTASRNLEAARANETSSGQMLLEIVDATRESLRTLTELPRNAAVQFVRDLDSISTNARARRATGARPPAAATGQRSPKAKPAAKRRARAKP